MNPITAAFEGGAGSELSFDGLGSDIEHSSTSSTGSNGDLRNSWLGMKYFDYLVAETLMSKAVKPISTECLEVSTTSHSDLVVVPKLIMCGAGSEPRTYAAIPLCSLSRRSY